MHAALSRGVLPFQAQAHLMWMYTGENDPTRALRQGLYEGKLMQEMLSLMFKGKVFDFPNKPSEVGFHANTLVSEVSICLTALGFGRF